MTLDIADGYCCIMGQLAGSFLDGIKAIPPRDILNTYAWVSEHGFDVMLSLDSRCSVKRASDTLTEAWRAAIEERRAQTLLRNLSVRIAEAKE